MDINQIVFIAVIIFLIFVIKVYPVLYQNKKVRYTRFFKSQNNVRFSLINEISMHQSNLPDDLSNEEMIGILALISAQKSVSQAYQASLRFADMGWKDKFDSDFFMILFTIGKKFQVKNWTRESTEIMNLGKMLAKYYEQPEWGHDYHREIENMRRIQLSTSKKIIKN